MDVNKNWEEYTVDVLIPVYQPDEKFERLLRMLYEQTVKLNQIIILHTIEHEGEELSLPGIPNSNITIIPIKKQFFDHGGTRKLGANHSDADIMVFMTQDAVPVDEYLIEYLLKPYQDTSIAATYARQLAHGHSDLLEEFTRNFNYPKQSYVKSKQDLKTLGIKTYFCSNVCASYRKDIYDKLGGFVERTIFNEDMILAATMIEAGYRIAYCAEAEVYHSHRYSYLQQLSRNFDLGVSHNQYSEIFFKVKSESEGIKLVKKSLQYLIDKKEFLLIPELILTSAFKYIGYQLGLHYDLFPENFVVHCSMNKGYWKKH